MEQKFVERKNNFGIFKKLLLFNFILLIILISSYAWLNFFREKKSIYNNMYARAESITNNLVKSYQDYIISLDYSFLEKGIRKIPDSDDILYSLFIDKDNNPVLKGDHQDIIISIPDSINEKSYASNKMLIQEFKISDKLILDVSSPIIIKDNKFGTLRIGFSGEKLQLTEKTIRKTAFYYAAIFLIIGGLFSYLLSKQIVLPIQECTKGAIKFAHGDYTHRININTKDETKTLSDAFNFMADKLHTTINELDLKLYNLTAIGQFNKMLNQTFLLESEYFYSNIVELVNEMLFLKISKLLIFTDDKVTEVTKIFGEEVVINENSDILSLNPAFRKVEITKNPILVKNMEEFEHKDKFGEYFTKTAMIVPILLNEKLLGIICAGDKTLNSNFEKKDLDFLLIIANEIASALNNINIIRVYKK
jgi:HAMP domain-containing protein